MLQSFYWKAAGIQNKWQRYTKTLTRVKCENMLEMIVVNCCILHNQK